MRSFDFGLTITNRGKLFGGTVPPNNTLFGGTVPPNNTLFGGTVPPNSTLFGGTPDSDKEYLRGEGQKMFQKVEKVQKFLDLIWKKFVQ